MKKQFIKYSLLLILFTGCSPEEKMKPINITYVDKSLLEQRDLKDDSNSVKQRKVELVCLKKDSIIDSLRFELTVKNWNKETYYGHTTLTIRDLKNDSLIQTIESDNFQFNRNLNFEFIELKDMNFDKKRDLVFFNGFQGDYGTQTYDYYLFDNNLNKYIFNNELAEIAGHMGIELDTIKKRIISYEKSGAMWHRTRAYVPQKDKFILIKSLTIDGFNAKIENKINGTWITKEVQFTEKNVKKLDALNRWF